jgi:ferredoxin
MEDAKAVVNTAECLGCGVCVTECPSNAMLLVAKPSGPVPPPRNWREMLLRIAQEKGRTYFFQ